SRCRLQDRSACPEYGLLCFLRLLSLFFKNSWLPFRQLIAGEYIMMFYRVRNRCFYQIIERNLLPCSYHGSFLMEFARNPDIETSLKRFLGIFPNGRTGGEVIIYGLMERLF